MSAPAPKPSPRQAFDEAEAIIAKVRQSVTAPRHAVTLTADRASAIAMIASIGALLEHAPKGTVDLVDCTPKVAVVDLEDGGLTASSTDALRLRFEPTDRIRELIAAVLAAEGNGNFVAVDSHGWPILSVVARNTTVTELPGARNGARQGGAA